MLLALILVNLIWSAHPAMGKLVLEDFSPAHAAWIRYFSAWMSYLVIALILRRKGAYKKQFQTLFLIPKKATEGILLLLLGFLPFCYSPLLQMTGLLKSQATDNALIVAMEPLFTVILARIFLGEKLSSSMTAAFGLALLGFFLMAGWDSHRVGNLLILVSLLGEAAYSVLGRKLLKNHSPIPVFGSAMTVGVGFLTVISFLEWGAPPLGNLTWHSAFGFFWLGPLGTMACYLFWMLAMSRITVASAALTLFVQPICGAIWGILFFGEKLGVAQGVGGALILAALLIKNKP